jgi:N-acetylneuraminic acid mutarotase
METGRINHTATLLANGRVLVAGGFGAGPVVLGTAELYDPVSGTWSSAASMGVPRAKHVAVRLLDGTVLVAGGQLANGPPTASAEIYHPSSDTWTSTEPMSVARLNFTATVLLDGRVLVTGGVGGDGRGVAVEKSAEIYDPLVGQWESAGKMANRRFSHAAVRLADGRVLVVGGAGGGEDCPYTKTAEVYAPSANEWQAADRMATPRGLPALALLPNGSVLAAGGLTQPASCNAEHGFNQTETAELYNALNDRWSPTSSLGTARRVFGFEQLADGRVLVAGGRNASGNAGILASAELYDPGDGTWSAAGSLSGPRVGVVLTTLTDGRVLASGGGDPVPVRGADLFSP